MSLPNMFPHSNAVNNLYDKQSLNSQLLSDERDSSHKTLNPSNEGRVIRQLIEALLFEKIVPYNFERDTFYFSMATIHFQATGYIGGFGRVRLRTNSIRQIKDQQSHIPSIDALVDALSLHLAISEKTKHQLQTELHQTIHLCNWNDEQQCSQFNDSSHNNHDNRRHLNYLELESAIDEGHPYHPCYKARTGFSLHDHAHYGPEQGNHFQLDWIAVRRCYLQQSLDNQGDSYFWQTELTEGAWLRLQRRMQELGTSWLEYGLLPVHPWQWKNIQTLPPLQAAVNAKHIVYLGAAGDKYQASISVRTLINVTRPEKANIKLPMNMVNSSSLRTIEPHSVCTAPLISSWLNDIVSEDMFFKTIQPLGLLREYAGILLADPDIDPALSDESHRWTASLAGQISVIFRESIHSESKTAASIDADSKPYLNNASTSGFSALSKEQINSNTVPFVALTQVEADKHPFIHPWVEQHGCEQWLSQLIDVAIIPVWHLLVHHGLAVEAHAQNMLLRHTDGWPQKIILRDFHESLEYVDSYIADKGKVPDFKSLYPCYREAKDNQYFG